MYEVFLCTLCQKKEGIKTYLGFLPKHPPTTWTKKVKKINQKLIVVGKKLFAFWLNMPYKHKSVNVLLFFPYQLVYPPLFVRSFLNHSKSKGRAEGFNIPAERLLNLVLAAGKDG